MPVRSRKTRFDPTVIVYDPPHARTVTVIEIRCTECAGTSVVAYDTTNPPPEDVLRHYRTRYECGVCHHIGGTVRQS